MQIRLTGLTAAAIGAGSLIPGTAGAQTLAMTLTIPRMKVAEYHAPYVAMWLERAGAPTRTIAVWYDVDNREGGKEGGTKWLRDVRQWWRVSGRTMKFPADGITGATRAPGTHKLSFTAGRGGMPALTPGAYTLVIEAAREVGGRELVRIPFNWNGSSASGRAAGTSELGAVSITVKR